MEMMNIYIPIEMVQHILSYLPSLHLYRPVCKTFNDIIPFNDRYYSIYTSSKHQCRCVLAFPIAITASITTPLSILTSIVVNNK